MKHLVQRAALAFAFCAVLIGSAAHATDAVESHLLQTLRTRFPTVKIDDNAVEPAPVPGLYQVIAGDHVLYTDPSGDHLILGSMIDTRTKQNLSDVAVDLHYSIDFKSLPLDEAIKIVKGNGARKVALFADPDCPYCQRLEREDMRSMTDVTVYLFLLPLEQVHPHAMADAKAIWCSPDRASAWTNWMLYHTPIPTGGSCANDPIPKIAALARSLHIDATPTLYLQNGRRIGGFVPLLQLHELMAKASPSNQFGLAASKNVPN